MDKLLILFGNPLDFPVVSEQLGVEFSELPDNVKETFFDLLGRLIHHIPDHDFSVVACGCSSQSNISSEVILHTLDVTKHGVGIAEFDAKKSCDIDELQNLANEKIVEIIAKSPLADIDIKDFNLDEEAILKARNVDVVIANDRAFLGNNTHCFIPRDQRIPSNSNCSRRNIGLQRKILRRWNRFNIWADFFYFSV